MPKVIDVRFRTSPRVYYFTPNDGEEYVKGDTVVVETQRGVELATVVTPPHDIDESKVVQPLKPITRIATEADIEAERADNEKKREILTIAKEKIAARGLDMKIVDCEFTVDHSKLVLYFTAEQRVDFRELVRDLASAFHIRIDLRQIGAREECKLVGSLGPCGLPCCCTRFESDSEHVSIKMAKSQNLALTPGKINGMCGRLLCCLAYENKTYEDVAKRAPKHGVWVTAPDGRRGTVVSVTPLTETVRLRFGDDENFEFGDFPMSELQYDRANPERPDKPQQKQAQPHRDADKDKKEKHKPDIKDRRNDVNGSTDASMPTDADVPPEHGKRRDRRNDVNGNTDASAPTDADVPPEHGKHRPRRNKRFRRHGDNGGSQNNAPKHDGE